MGGVSWAEWGRRLLHPRSWPVRWRLAAVSAGLTLAILFVFGAAVGKVATERIRADFDSARRLRRQRPRPR